MKYKEEVYDILKEVYKEFLNDENDRNELVEMVDSHEPHELFKDLCEWHGLEASLVEFVYETFYGNGAYISMKTPISLRMITEEEFHKLKGGDTVYIKASGHTFQSKVLNTPIWNSDADEPGWEVETTYGWSDMYSLYVR